MTDTPDTADTPTQPTHADARAVIHHGYARRA